MSGINDAAWHWIGVASSNPEKWIAWMKTRFYVERVVNPFSGKEQDWEFDTREDAEEAIALRLLEEAA